MFGQHTYDSSMHAWLNQSLEFERQYDYVFQRLDTLESRQLNFTRRTMLL